MAGRFWTSDEVETLKTYGPTHTVRQLSEKLQDRTPSQVRAKLRELDIPRVKAPKVLRDTEKVKLWKDWEIAILRDNPTLSYRELHEKLPHRSVACIRVRVRKMNLRPIVQPKKFWTKEDELQLMDLSERWPAKTIAKKMGRTRPGVEFKMRRMGLRPTSDCVSLRQACEDTGYAATQFERARVALGQEWRFAGKRGKGGRFTISSEQYDQLLQYLKNEKPKSQLTPEERFAKRLTIDEDSKCWLWNGSTHGCKTHFSCVYFDEEGKPHNLYRRPVNYAWQIVKGEMYNHPLKRLCSTANCVNPDHFTKDFETPTYREQHRAQELGQLLHGHRDAGGDSSNVQP